VGTSELEQQLALLARRLSKPVQLPGQSGFTVLDRPVYQALWRIVEGGPTRLTALAKALGVDLSVVSRQVKALEEVGFVERQTDPLDARAALVSATASGQHALEVSRQKRSEVLEEVLSGWSELDRAEMVRLLSRFNAELETVIEQRLAAAGVQH
jgi:DNA-binding MarR family transcriptional regulator